MELTERAAEKVRSLGRAPKKFWKSAGRVLGEEEERQREGVFDPGCSETLCFKTPYPPSSPNTPAHTHAK